VYFAPRVPIKFGLELHNQDHIIGVTRSLDRANSRTAGAMAPASIHERQLFAPSYQQRRESRSFLDALAPPPQLNQRGKTSRSGAANSGELMFA
jgi:hypothetical protein